MIIAFLCVVGTLPACLGEPAQDSKQLVRLQHEGKLASAIYSAKHNRSQLAHTQQNHLAQKFNIPRDSRLCWSPIIMWSHAGKDRLKEKEFTL